MEQGMTADQVVAALWRRKGLIAAMAVVLFALGAAVVVAIPAVYKSTVVVRVEPTRPSKELIQTTVDDPVDQHLKTVRQQLMGRPVLQKAIEELNLYPEIVSKSGIDSAVERMRTDLEVKVEGDNAFELTYGYSDPQTAAKATNRLPEIYAEQEVQLRQGQAARATALFADQMENLKATVTGWERKIAQFKVERLGELPEQMEMNMRGLERIGMELRTKADELTTAEGRRSELARAHHSIDTEAGRLLAAENTVGRQLVEARATWTEDHPETSRLARQSQVLKQQREESEGRLVSERQERARASSVVARIEADIGRLQKSAEVYQARLERTPRWANDLGVMQRDYEAARTKYQSVVSRRVEAELAQDMEAKGAKSLFNVISPASVSAAPAKPDRPTGLLIAALVALGLSVLTAIVLEMRDDSIRTVHQLKDRLPLPILAVVPEMSGKAARRVLAPANPNYSSPAALN
jgi:polysaccharide chain length determinant protein (PEP-CTERM system associated)